MPDPAPYPPPHLLEAALEVCRRLVLAYNNGEARGGDIEWDDLDVAHESAVDALEQAGEDPKAYVDDFTDDEESGS